MNVSNSTTSYTTVNSVSLIQAPTNELNDDRLELSPEQQNNLNDAQENARQEKRDTIESSFDKALNIDLARVYLEQRQRVIDAYTDGINNNDSNDNNFPNNDVSAVSSLKDFYEQIAEIKQATEDTLNPPAINNEVTNLPASQQVSEYQNNINSENNSSFYHAVV